jgi:ATP synthase protein I
VTADEGTRRDADGAARPDLRRRFAQDADRYARRDERPETFWRSLAVIGSVGWPIVLAAAGGAIAGRWLDVRWNTGIRMTLVLLVAGVSLGAWIAWRAVRQQEDR